MFPKFNTGLERRNLLTLTLLWWSSNGFGRTRHFVFVQGRDTITLSVRNETVNPVHNMFQVIEGTSDYKGKTREKL